jgi:hypothetical protein
LLLSVVPVLLVLVVLRVTGPGLVRDGGAGPACGQQKSSWPEAQEVAGERDVAFAVR